MPSYHDVVVIVDGKSHTISDNYAYELTCTRTSGWSLWWRWGMGASQQIGGEFHGGKFTIEVAGVVICGEKQDVIDNAQSTGGWDGAIDNT